MAQLDENTGDYPPPYASVVPYPPQQPQPWYPPQQNPGAIYPPPASAMHPPQQPPAGAAYPPQQQAMVHSTPQQQGTQQFLMLQTAVNTCPKCRVGVLQDYFTIPGICCAILFFPLGLVCCFLTRERHCTNCGAEYM